MWSADHRPSLSNLEELVRSAARARPGGAVAGASSGAPEGGGFRSRSAEGAGATPRAQARQPIGVPLSHRSPTPECRRVKKTNLQNKTERGAWAPQTHRVGRRVSPAVRAVGLETRPVVRPAPPQSLRPERLCRAPSPASLTSARRGPHHRPVGQNRLLRTSLPADTSRCKPVPSPGKAAAAAQPTPPGPAEEPTAGAGAGSRGGSAAPLGGQGPPQASRATAVSLLRPELLLLSCSPAHRRKPLQRLRQFGLPRPPRSPTGS